MYIFDLPNKVLEAVAHASMKVIIDDLATPTKKDECAQLWQEALDTPPKEMRRSRTGPPMFRWSWLLRNASVIAYVAEAPARGDNSERLLWLWSWCDAVGGSGGMEVPVFVMGDEYVGLQVQTFGMVWQRLPQDMRNVFELAVALGENVVWAEVADKAALFAAK
jgi:hypothetical protein